MRKVSSNGGILKGSLQHAKAFACYFLAVIEVERVH